MAEGEVGGDGRELTKARLRWKGKRWRVEEEVNAP